MDRHSRWFCSSLLALFCLAGCAAKPVVPQVDPVKEAQDARCAALTPHRESCGFQGDVMMVVTVAQLPTYDKKDRLNPRTFSGTCEVVARLADGSLKPSNARCPALRLEVTNPSVLGDKARLSSAEGDKFFIGGLPKGKYNLLMVSETFKTQAEIRDVPSGARLKIQFQIAEK